MENVTDFAISLNVPDPEASAGFLIDHFGYGAVMRNAGFVSLKHPGSERPHCAAGSVGLKREPRF